MTSDPGSERLIRLSDYGVSGPNPLYKVLVTVPDDWGPADVPSLQASLDSLWRLDKVGPGKEFEIVDGRLVRRRFVEGTS